MKIPSIFSVLLSLTLLLLAASPAYAVKFMTSEGTASLPAGEVVDDDLFIAGQSVQISGTVLGDVYAAGQSVQVDGEIYGDLVAAGNNVTINGLLGDDAWVGAGSVYVDNTDIGGSLRAGAGTLTLSPTATVSGSLLAGAGSVLVQGDVYRNVIVGGGDVSIDGTVMKDVHLGTGNLVIGQGAAIDGNLAYNEDASTDISNDSSISGTITTYQTDNFERDRFNKRIEMRSRIHNLAIFPQVYGFLSSLLIGLALVYFAPKLLKSIVDQIEKQPLKSGLIGLLGIFLILPIFVVMFLTIIGIPFAFLYLAALTISMMVAKLFGAVFLGKVFLDRDAKTLKRPYHYLLLGLGIYYVAGLVPVLGWIVQAGMFLMGFGAIMLAKTAYIKKK